MSKLSLETTIKLTSGHSIPQLGFGVYQARGSECENAVKEAIKAGYRHSMSLLLFSHLVRLKVSSRQRTRVQKRTSSVPPPQLTKSTKQSLKQKTVVGQAVAATKLPRSEIFLTTKYMPTHTPHPANDVYKELRKSITKIDQVSKDAPYIDLMLIHAPWGGDKGRNNNWEALKRAQEEGWIRDIGVSNL